MKPSNIESISVVIFLDVTLVFSNAMFAQYDLTMYEPLRGEIPSLVSLMSKLDDNRNCVGVLITRWHTMTSCSCLIAPTQAIKESKHVPEKFILVAGITTIDNEKAKGQIRKIKLFVIHPHCEKDGKLVKYDIGIAVSEKPFDLGKYVLTAKIPFTLEAHKQSQFFNSMLSKRKSSTATLVSWYKAKTKKPSLVFVRLYVDQYSAECKNYTERTKHEGEEHRYTCVNFQTEFFCPSFDEAAIFSDDYVFFGVVTGIKERICRNKPIFFTNIDTTLEWIVHVVGKGNVREFKPSIIILVISLYPLVLNKQINI